MIDATNQSPRKQSPRKQSPRKLLILLSATILIPCIPFVIIGELPGDRWLSAVDANAVTFTLVSAALLVADVLLPVPSSIVVTMMGARLDFFAGWLAAWLALCAGHMLGYLLGRIWPRRLAPEVPERPSLLMVIATRPIPILAEAVALSAGATRLPVMGTMTAFAIGNLAYTGLLTATGAALLPNAATAWGVALIVALPVFGWMLWRSSSRFTGPG